ncbi:MAG: 50S ribosomal protein L18 [bacterium]
MKVQSKIKQIKRARRHRRIRVKVKGTSERPRLSVFRSLSHLYVQLIDDEAGQTLASVRDSEIKTKGQKSEVALAVGKLLAEKALAKKITKVVFDRGGHKFHGRIKAVAEGARQGGLKF